MRIGQVSRKYDISVDNLYYYINYGLLVPKRPNSQYDFDEQTLKDLEIILELKSLRFSLKEIHEILSLYRISGITAPQDVADLKRIYNGKLTEIQGERHQLDKMTRRLESKIRDLNEQFPAHVASKGVPLSMLEILCCPNCGGSFSLENVSMSSQYLFEGNLKCSCGYCAHIEKGVLITPNRNKDEYDTPDIDRKLYRDLPPSLISLFQKSYNWMLDRLAAMDTDGKVVMETYINAWFFMHNHQAYLNPKAKYIVVDKYPEMLYMYKELMEKQGYDLDILFIADSSTRLPLKHGCVDLNIDYFALNEHNFYHDSFLYDKLAPFFNEKTQLLGTYFYFDKGKKSMQTLLTEYPTCSQNNFSLPFFMSHMKDYIVEDEDCGYTTSSGSNIGFSFHAEGERMYLHSYLARGYHRE